MVKVCEFILDYIIHTSIHVIIPYNAGKIEHKKILEIVMFIAMFIEIIYNSYYLLIYFFKV